MKKMLLFLAFIVGFIQSKAQTNTVTGATTTPAVNKTYTLCNGCGFSYTTAEIKDAGTDAYFDVPTSGIPFDQYQIYRNNGQWKLAQVAMCMGCTSPQTYIYYKVTANTNKPPCNTSWTVGNTANVENIALTGDCVNLAPPSVNATTILPNVLTLPQLTAAEIAAITSPQKGMIVFDTSNNCLKLYNGTAWARMSTN